MDEFEIAILGAGISGISAAQRAAESGARVCLIEKDRIGGRCVHQGLFPYMRMMNQIVINGSGASQREAGGRGREEISKLFEDTIQFSQEISKKREAALKESGVHIETGEGTLIGPNEIRILGPMEEKVVKAQKIIVATGSDMEAPATMPFDGERIISCDEVFKVGKAPDSVLILGGGGAGCELASLYNRLGSKTFLSDEASRLLQDQDTDIIEAAEGGMKKQKVKMLLNKKVVSIFKDESAIDISLDGGVKFAVQTMVLMSGRKARTQNLGADAIGVRIGEKRQILVDEKQETTVNGVYAVGSVTGRASFHGLSEEEGRVAVENALGKKASLNKDWIPRIVYTHPEIATVGCHAQDAHHKGFRAVEGICTNNQLEPSLIRAGDAGLFKIVADKTSRKIIGGQIVSSRASEFIPLILLSIKRGLPVSSLARLSCGISTPLQGIREAARACVQALRI
ncbi:MAG: dihydrolipoyl dehydrogenase [Nitrospinaceae bacterium]|nr:MAG: dihydrolipoyl dehydrogenase [Nitrospinaceae bacterium]